jgi:hypothetical protein
MPRYRDWDRDPEEYRPRPSRENPYQRRRRWDDEDFQDKKNNDNDDDWDDSDQYQR